MSPRRRKLGRRLLNAASTLSLVLALLVALLWARGSWWRTDRYDVITRTDAKGQYCGHAVFSHVAGRMDLIWADHRNTKTGKRSSFCDDLYFGPIGWTTEDPYPTHWRVLIGWKNGLLDNGHYGWEAGIQISDWLLLLLLSIAPIARFIAHRRDLARIGLCESCGYDLRASIDRCPECGEPIPAKTAKMTDSPIRAP
ncbi:MAG: hypothetical protein NTW19_05290 [Planctomycetota bacterium]|nr:hypothetical protein [Planctomycetota bacterium]